MRYIPGEQCFEADHRPPVIPFAHRKTVQNRKFLLHGFMNEKTIMTKDRRKDQHSVDKINFRFNFSLQLFFL